MPWCLSWRADPVAAAMADRHYSRQKAGTAQFVPPGRCLVLVAVDNRAVWTTSWPMAEFTHHAWAGAWVCSIFRRESDCAYRASDLIVAAVAATRWRWPDVPDLGMITFVDAGAVLHKRDPGRCFLRAGFRLVGKTKVNGLLAFQMRPGEMPDALAPVGAQETMFEEGSFPRADQ